MVAIFGINSVMVAVGGALVRFVSKLRPLAIYLRVPTMAPSLSRYEELSGYELFVTWTTPHWDLIETCSSVTIGTQTRRIVPISSALDVRINSVRKQTIDKLYV
ncbi:hypothetical protein QE152_g26329 [Popillia japonica]|uniref:Uncharacterized protein n=1 Tax=Popillia japonica TaxID=7064 RepID=A0AAW1JYJ4_POPJA